MSGTRFVVDVPYKTANSSGWAERLIRADSPESAAVQSVEMVERFDPDRRIQVRAVEGTATEFTVRPQAPWTLEEETR